MSDLTDPTPVGEGAMAHWDGQWWMKIYWAEAQLLDGKLWDTFRILQFTRERPPGEDARQGTLHDLIAAGMEEVQRSHNNWYVALHFDTYPNVNGRQGAPWTAWSENLAAAAFSSRYPWQNPWIYLMETKPHAHPEQVQVCYMADVVFSQHAGEFPEECRRVVIGPLRQTLFS